MIKEHPQHYRLARLGEDNYQYAQRSKPFGGSYPFRELTLIHFIAVIRALLVCLLLAGSTSCRMSDNRHDEFSSLHKPPEDSSPQRYSVSSSGTTAAPEAISVGLTTPKKDGGSSSIPESLVGVWYENNEYGRFKCSAYKSIDPKIQSTDESSAILIGARIVQKNLIHAYSEYGEGNFYVIKRVLQLEGNKWELNSLVHVDALPSAEDHGSEVTHRLTLSSGLLSWSENYVESNGNKVSSLNSFFKCGPIRKDIYPADNGGPYN